MTTHVCTGCGTTVDDETVVWATYDGRLTTDRGLPWCVACVPTQDVEARRNTALVLMHAAEGLDGRGTLTPATRRSLVDKLTQLAAQYDVAVVEEFRARRARGGTDGRGS